jgi:hypothetical protein
MKRFSIGLSIAVLVSCTALSSCEQKVQIESIVHEDGSIDRAIVLVDADSARFRQNMFGITSSTGWETDWKPGIQKPNEPKNYNIRFRKSYTSAEAANSDSNKETDSLFRIKSEFKKEFRWFYTYIRYSDTYIALNRFHTLSADDYFTVEDFAFIDRLPAEGRPISKGDSLYYSRLNEKILDIFASRAIFEEYFLLMSDYLKKQNVEQRWMDSLKSRKEWLFQKLQKDDKIGQDEEVITAMARLVQIPVKIIKEEVRAMSRSTTGRIDFMTDASEGKWSHSVQMPWTVIHSNADSIAQSSLFWKPPVIKFMLNDYTMYAESRKLNYWAVAVSLVIVGLFGWAMVRKKRLA